MTDTKTPDTTPRAALAALLADHGIDMTADRDPYTKPTDPEQFRWHVRLTRRGRTVWEGAYHAGIGHAVIPPVPKGWGGRQWKGAINAAVRQSVRSGARVRVPESWSTFDPWPTPDPVDVVSCLALDASALDHPTFESWASDFGYDPDSRTGEATYRACLGIGLALRSSLGDTVLSEMRSLAGEV